MAVELPMGFMVDVLNWASRAKSSSAMTLASSPPCDQQARMQLPSR